MKKIILGILLTIGTLMAMNLKSCQGCHGHDWSKSAFGKSKIVSRMSKEEIITALTGYKNGTYGGSMKSLMKNQVLKYNDEEIISIAQEITKEKFLDTNKSIETNSSLIKIKL